MECVLKTSRQLQISKFSSGLSFHSGWENELSIRDFLPPAPSPLTPFLPSSPNEIIVLSAVEGAMFAQDINPLRCPRDILTAAWKVTAAACRLEHNTVKIGYTGTVVNP